MKHTKKLTILHSNDMHGDFLAESVDDKLLGGVSMLSGYVSQVRSQEKNVLYTISGDMFRGSVIDAEYKGVSTIEIMNMLAPDIVTLGNHEIDYGLAHLLFIEKCAKFPIINANLFITTTHSRLFQPHKVLEIDGMKILFIGILTEEILAQTRQDSLIGSFVDVAQAAEEVGKITNSYQSIDIDLTVLLTHIGFEEDKQLAAKLDPEWGVDLIIGGHSHTILEHPEKVNDILITQAGTGTDQIGRYDIVIDTDRNCVDSYKWQLVPINSDNCPRDEDLEACIKKYKNQTDQKYARIVTRLNRQLTHPSRTQETEMGDLFADILKDSFGVDIMLLGSGSIRLERLGPIVEFGNLTETFPYDDSVHMIKVNGEQLTRMIRRILRDEAWTGHTEFYQFSRGIKMNYRKSTKQLDITFDGQPLDPNRLYSVGLQKYHYSNLKEFLDVTPEETEANCLHRVLSTSCRDVIEEYLAQHQHLDAHVEGRLTVTD